MNGRRTERTPGGGEPRHRAPTGRSAPLRPRPLVAENPWGETGSDAQAEAAAIRSRRRLTRIMLVLGVIVLTVLGAEIAYFIGQERAPAPPAATPQWSGWTAVSDAESHAGYRVPPGFTVEDPVQRRSLGQQVHDRADLVVLRSTVVLFDECRDTGGVSALAGFVERPAGEPVGTPARLVTAAAEQALTHRDGTVPRITAPAPTELTLADGSSAQAVTVIAPVTEAYPCSPPRLRFTAVNLQQRGQDLQFLASLGPAEPVEVDAGPGRPSSGQS